MVVQGKVVLLVAPPNLQVELPLQQEVQAQWHWVQNEAEQIHKGWWLGTLGFFKRHDITHYNTDTVDVLDTVNNIAEMYFRIDVDAITHKRTVDNLMENCLSYFVCFH